MTRRFALLAWIAVAAGSSAAGAQTAFDTWSTENGLPQNSINDIAQTRDGYLWLATYGGLVRFDGARFVVFDRSTSGIASQRIKRLHEDRAGLLWAATEEGMLIRYRDGRFTTFGAEHGLPAANTFRLEESDDGHLWVTSEQAVSEFDGERAPSYGPEAFAGRVAMPRVNGLHEVWWGRDAMGLHVLIAGRITTYDVDQAVGAARITGVNDDSAGNLWVRTDGAGVVRIGAGRMERYTTREGLASNSPVGQFHADRSGGIWYSWMSETDPDRRVHRIASGTRTTVELSAVLAVFVDREGSTWLGTPSSGLQRVRESSVTLYAERDGLSWNWVYSILRSRSGVVWIGTWGGGLNRFEHGRFSRFTTAQGLASNLITSLHEDASGRLWVGTSGGLGYIKDGRVQRYGEESSPLAGPVYAIHEDRRRRLWFGTDAGLVQEADGRFAQFTTREGLPNDHITALLEDREGALWIGTLRGLTCLVDDHVVPFVGHEDLDTAHVRAIHEDQRGALWIGTYDSGLYRLAGGRLFRFTRREGLYDNGVFQILEDDAGYLWTGSNRGISRVSRQALEDVADGRKSTVTPTVLGTRDGLMSAETNGGRQPAGWKMPDGRLWFPTMGGVAVLDPARMPVSTATPASLVEDVQVAGRPVDFMTTVTVPPDAPTLTIRYTAATFIKPELIRFRYRLEGLDDEWIEGGEARTATYHRMPAGRYAFHVVAASHDGVWDTGGATVRITVQPRFWRTWWFAALSAGVTLAAALTIHQSRVRRIQKEHARQAVFSRELIESQEHERQRLSREMHDSIGQHLAIIRRRARSGREQSTANDAVAGELEEIARVAEAIDADVKEIARGLRPYQLDTIGLSKTLTRMVQRAAGASGLECVTEIAAIDDALLPEAQIHVYRIVQEALNNVLKHSSATRVRVAVRLFDRVVEIQVADNGVGMPARATDSQRAASHGFGLMGLRERARILGGQLQIRTNADGGTTVEVTAPLEAGE